MDAKIKLYYALQPEQKNVILERSDQDIELDAVFPKVDYTVTVIGKQYLYRQLKMPLGRVEALNSLEQQLAYYSKHKTLGDFLGREGKSLSGQDSGDLPYLIFGTELTPQWYYKWVPILQVLMGVSVLLAFYVHWGILVAFGLFGLHLYLHFHNKMMLDSYRRSLLSVMRLYDFCELMQRKHKEVFDEVATDAFAALGTLRKYLNINQSLQLFTSSEVYMLFWLLYELLKALTLVEVAASKVIIREVNLKRSLVHVLYKLVGRADFLLSIIKLRSHRTCCIPAFVSDCKGIHIKGIYHPLIEHCIKNDFMPAGSSILITGSNAAGKSSFLRTLALNNILAASLHTCFADQYILPLLTTVATMHHRDHLEEGLSHYQSEVKRVVGTFKLCNEKDCLLLFDEPFNGTNSRERVAIAASMLQYFARQPNLLTIVSSHDFELLQLLDGQFKMYFFNEQVHPDGRVSFDYKLKKGKKVTRNALELIRVEEFPTEVVAQANALYEQLEALSIRNAGG